MSATELRLRYRPDDEWHGEIDAAVTSGAFSGKGSAWFSKEQVKDTFAAPLRAFPLSTDDPPLIEGGYWSAERPGFLEQCHLRIVIRPYCLRGSLLVEVDLATKFVAAPDAGPQQAVTARFLTEYEAVSTFASQLEQVLDGNRKIAVLLGIRG